MHPMALIIHRCRGNNLKLDTACELLASLTVCEWSLNLVHIHTITLLTAIELKTVVICKNYCSKFSIHVIDLFLCIHEKTYLQLKSFGGARKVIDAIRCAFIVSAYMYCNLKWILTSVGGSGFRCWKHLRHVDVSVRLCS